MESNTVEMVGPAGLINVPLRAVDRYRGRGYLVNDREKAKADLESRSVLALQDLVASRGVTGVAAARKADLIKALLRSFGLEEARPRRALAAPADEE